VDQTSDEQSSAQHRPNAFLPSLRGSGAPRGNRNALKHGNYTRDAIAERQMLKDLVRESRKLLQQIK
jgi:hypothetical protein